MQVDGFQPGRPNTSASTEKGREIPFNVLATSIALRQGLFVPGESAFSPERHFRRKVGTVGIPAAALFEDDSLNLGLVLPEVVGLWEVGHGDLDLGYLRT